MAKLFSMAYNNELFLIEGCREKKRLAQRQLFSIYHKKMMAICIQRYLKNEEEAFEVLNEVLFKVFDKIKQFKPETK